MVSQGLTPKSDTHFESIWILAFLSDKCDSWSNYQLNYLPQQGEILTQRSNLTTQRAKKTLISCIWYRSRFRHKAGLLRTFPPFFPETRKLESAVYSEQNIFSWHITSAECTEKNLSPWSRIWSISSHLYFFSNRRRNWASKHINLSSSSIHHLNVLYRHVSRSWWMRPQANKDIYKILKSNY